MKTIGYITIWFVLGCIINAPIHLFQLNMKVGFLPCLAFLGCLFSINFASMSACITALLKYKEFHQSANISFVISEIKENMIAMLAGIGCITIAYIIKEIAKNYSIYSITYIAESIVYGVIVMYFWLISDIILAFLQLVNENGGIEKTKNV